MARKAQKIALLSESLKSRIEYSSLKAINERSPIAGKVISLSKRAEKTKKTTIILQDLVLDFNSIKLAFGFNFPQTKKREEAVNKSVNIIATTNKISGLVNKSNCKINAIILSFIL